MLFEQLSNNLEDVIMRKSHGHCALVIWAILVLFGSAVYAQNRPNPTPGDTLHSYNILPDHSVVFRIYAPNALEVTWSCSDMQGAKMTKQENGVWTVTIGPVDPGAYRYHFAVDGLAVLDPLNPATSESSSYTRSLIYIPGAAFMDTQDVPHGAVSSVTYYSRTLQKFRRMHVYTPPGYEMGKGKYPVFYLLHGAYDCDDAWPTVGRAGFILDNLIAEKKAVPMIVVMPTGHTKPFRFGGERSRSHDEFVDDFVNDIKPYIETHYRVRADQAHRAIAGLSMGGAQTLSIAIPHLKDYGYLGVFSSGVFGIAGGNGAFGVDGATWEERNKAVLDNPDLKKGLKRVWFATGKDDFLLETSRATVDALKRHGFDVVYKESEGAHVWTNWRDYLNEFAPLLFR